MSHPSRPRSALRRALCLSSWDGVAFAFMVGTGETALVADALRLGGSQAELGLVVTLPLLLGALGPLIALRVLARVPSRRALAVTTALLQGLNWLALGALDLLGWNDPTILIGAAALHQVFGQACATGWSSWFGDLVPARLRGRVFGLRNRRVYLSTCLGMAAGGALLEWLEPVPGSGEPGGLGFAWLFGLAGLARLGSTALLRATREPRFAGLAPPRRVLRFLASERGTRGVRLLLYSGAMYLAVYLASPYFAPFMLEDLGFGYGEFMAASIAVVVLKVLSVPLWGRVVDGHGARPSFALAALLVAVVPLPWLWTGGLGWALAAQALSGLSWAGYDVTLFALVLESSRSDTRPHVFALQSLLNGAGQLLGGLLGAGLLGALGGGLRLVFAVSLGARLILALLVPVLVPRGRSEPRLRHRDLVLRMVGWRPAGGVAHRPVSWPVGSAGDTDEPPSAAG